MGLKSIQTIIFLAGALLLQAEYHSCHWRLTCSTSQTKKQIPLDYAHSAQSTKNIHTVSFAYKDSKWTESDTFSVQVRTTLVNSVTTISTHASDGSFSFSICFLTIVSNAMSGVNSPVLHTEYKMNGQTNRRMKRRTTLCLIWQSGRVET